MSLNQSMNIATGSLKNNQYALTVVSHNIANIHTEGYVRQGVNFQESRYDTGSNNVVGIIKGMNGATISELKDYVDMGAFNDVIKTNSDAEYYNTIKDNISGLEDIVNALGDDGLNALLNDFFAASANLEKYPDDISIRQQFLLCAENVADKFNDVSKQIDAKEQDTLETTQDTVKTVDNLFKKLAEANAQYVKSDKSTAAKNEINSVLKELSNYIDVKYDTNTNGTVNLYVGNIKVVQGASQNYSLKSSMDGGKFSMHLQSTTDENYTISKGITDAFSTGSLAANIEFLNGTNDKYFSISGLKDKVDSVANAFASELNKIQTYDDGDVFAANITNDGKGNLILEKSTENLFTTKDGSTTFNASNISLNSNIKNNPWLVAAARIDTTKYKADEWKNAVGNSDNAVEITALQNKKICSYAINNDTTLSKFLSSLATDIGTNVDYVKDKADTANSVADSSATNFANLIGVNLDEELTDMIKYQRSYEASAKLFSTVNGLYDTILGMV